MADTPTGSITFELVSPEQLLVSQPVEMVVLPGSEGRFAVLVGHAPLIAQLRAGTIEIFENDRTTVSQRIFVGGGVAEATAEHCVVLAELAIPVGELDRARISERAQALRAEGRSLALEVAEELRTGTVGELALHEAMLEAINQAA